MTVELAAAGAPIRPGGPGRTVAPAERGALRIADGVVSKIAAQAAREALDVLPPDAGPPHATVVVLRRSRPLPHSRDRSSGGTPMSGGTLIDVARVRIGLELDYPSDIGAQCAAVRRQVTERVRMLAGMEVSEVAVQVERLHSAQARGAAQGRTR